jgi:hypothetical protein
MYKTPAEGGSVVANPIKLKWSIKSLPNTTVRLAIITVEIVSAIASSVDASPSPVGDRFS